MNFRDVGEWIALLGAENLLPARRLLRGGKLDAVREAAEIGHPGTIVNLRQGPDRHTFGAEYRHVSIPNSYEKYDTTDATVRRWLNAVAQAVCEAPAFPVMLHCTSGKDRTGVAVALLLTALGAPRAIIVEEYLLSDGEVERAWIERALDGIGDVRRYLARVDVQRLRERLRSV
ncbi:tyrosine-protein phosphatase [Polyangium jinanense]|uniref:Tyrosine-protein phosphatase n=1 Tax=Polyangium jinanense TaxID=2829994 RepID=A0A9X3X845_9BACT|nr:tyrosine-protein phosphatase [Polyangium jinanense]MDC3960688.1 tyrosine-protein phosphatase [Polyangium jinanense]MDC3984520.1 tyrosine-protein phosphatase [Polyangium jinanense]